LDLGPALPHVFVVQHIGAEKMHMRSVGSAVCALLGEHPRALAPTALVAKKDRKAFAGLLHKAIRDPAIVFMSLRGSGQNDGQSSPAVQPATQLAMQMILLPLRDQEGQITRVLGCIDGADLPPQLGRVQANGFSLVNYFIRPLKSAEYSTTDSAYDNSPPDSFYDKDDGGAGSTAPPAPKVPHLRVIKGGKNQ